jgi:hypothetical protein
MRVLPYSKALQRECNHLLKGAEGVGVSGGTVIKRKIGARTCAIENVVFVEFKPAKMGRTDREAFDDLIEECRSNRAELQRLVRAISRAIDATAAAQVQK